MRPPPAVSGGGSRGSASARRSVDRDRSTGGADSSSFLARASATPLAAVSDALAGAVAAVAKARGGRLGRGTAEDGGGGGDAGAATTDPALSDDAAARRLALRSQDSLSLNHARLARDRLRKGGGEGGEGEEDDERGAVVTDVVEEHVKRAAAALLAALVARDPEVAREVEVVAARVDYASGGKVSVLRRAWLGARGTLYE